MQEIIVYVIVLAAVILAVRYAIRKLGGKGQQQQEACSGCPLKDNCGKRGSGRSGQKGKAGEQCTERDKQYIK